MRHFLVYFVAFCLISQLVQCQLNEGERVSEYQKREYQWPAPDEDFIPNTEGWRAIMRRRFNQVQEIKDHGDKYNGFMSTVYQSFIGKNFTEYGWALTKAPQVCLHSVLV